MKMWVRDYLNEIIRVENVLKTETFRKEKQTDKQRKGWNTTAMQLLNKRKKERKKERKKKERKKVYW